MAKVNILKNGNAIFYCPGCDTYHECNLDNDVPGNWPAWEFTGELDNPTIKPSVLCNKDEPSRRCHLFVKNGKIEYLSDCFHDLKGQTVDMYDIITFDENEEDGTRIENITNNSRSLKNSYDSIAETIQKKAEEVEEFIKTKIIEVASSFHFGIENDDKWIEMMNKDPKSVFDIIKEHGFDISIEHNEEPGEMKDGKYFVNSKTKIKFVSIMKEITIDSTEEVKE